MAQTNEVFNVGVIGYGLSAKVFHIPFITTTPSFSLHSILQRNPQPSSSAPDDYPSLRHFKTLEPFLADADLDVVVLTTTPDTHFSLAQQALNAGKHVFVEKPFVPTSDEATELIRLASEKNLKICVYQNRRWDADFQTVQKLVSENTLGTIYEFETHFDRYRADAPTNWKGELSMSRGGSALYDLGTHLVDQAYVLFGRPTSVFAKLLNQRSARVLSPSDTTVEPDAVNMQLFYGSGLIVHVRIGVLSAEVRQPRFWIRGSKGSYHKDGLDPQEGQLRNGMKTSDAQFGRESEEWAGRLVTLATDGQMCEESCPNVEPPVTYRKIYEAFGEALKGNGDVPVPAEEARDVLRILEAARESSLTSREVELHTN
ncbi:hypothetical protein F5B22DRAFT_536208 [Xylaria bambusicola]|uniref:uncharacterized protein n=1 Tax=Xylaria bambusicola TaxID=326684 RepID=UPI00200784C5|nr:uncharacterized protein F5B22DRAFT_536208 [Xylaria bambusicola]KAI0505173.1 hypothetical protein F5B22DRAFT_536208 [Xylaria bambusicola]